MEEEQASKRSEQEEMRLWRFIEECGREQAKEEERNNKYENGRVKQARMKKSVGKDQPSITDIMKM